MLRHFLAMRWPAPESPTVPSGRDIPHGVHTTFAHDPPVLTLDRSHGAED
jgi:hypothetical protein